jgi:hypothetical protein
MKFVLPAIALLVCGMAAPEPRSSRTANPPPATQSSSASNANTASAEQPVCRRIAASESRVAARRVCRTRAEWRRIDRESD